MDLFQRDLATKNKAFFQISNSFFNYWLETIIFKQIARCEYWSKCNVLAIYQWIRLNELYEKMESFFFFNFEIIFQINYNFYNNSGVGFIHACWGRHLC